MVTSQSLFAGVYPSSYLNVRVGRISGEPSEDAIRWCPSATGYFSFAFVLSLEMFVQASRWKTYPRVSSFGRENMAKDMRMSDDEFALREFLRVHPHYSLGVPPTSRKERF